MAESAGSVVSLQDIGAIESAEIPLNPGTIVVMTGDNGVGKSTAINAVVSAIDGQNRGLKPRDGKMAGKARIPGATVTFGTKVKRVSNGDDVSQSFVVVEDGSGISQILKPGIKDPAAADKKRLEGVLELIGAELSDESQREFLGEHYAGFSESRDVKGAGFVDTVKAMKLYLEKAAREYTVRVDEWNGAMAQIGEVPPDVVVTESVGLLADKLSELSVQTRDARKAREAADKGLLVIDSTQPLKSIEKTEEAIVASRLFILQTEEKISDLAESLRDAKLILVKNEAILDTERQAQKGREALRAVIDSAPTAEAIAELQKSLEDVTEKHQDAVLASDRNKQYAKQRADSSAVYDKLIVAEKTRDSIKEKAYRLPQLLHKAMVAVPGWKVDEEFRLCVEHKRGSIPFSELSPGEGTARVCLLACQFADFDENQVPVVGLPQECWEGLDGKNRHLLLESVKEHGLCIATAQATGEDEEIIGIKVRVLS